VERIAELCDCSADARGFFLPIAYDVVAVTKHVRGNDEYPLEFANNRFSKCAGCMAATMVLRHQDLLVSSDLRRGGRLKTRITRFVGC
jgi:hypothetical protein